LSLPTPESHCLVSTCEFCHVVQVRTTRRSLRRQLEYSTISDIKSPRSVPSRDLSAQSTRRPSGSTKRRRPSTPCHGAPPPSATRRGLRLLRPRSRRTRLTGTRAGPSRDGSVPRPTTRRRCRFYPEQSAVDQPHLMPLRPQHHSSLTVVLIEGVFDYDTIFTTR